MRGFFVTGIGTGIGKTVVSAVLCEALEADYWKPIQAGNVENSDSTIVRHLISNTRSTVLPEIYSFKTACSPHLAARLDGIEIDLDSIRLPARENAVIVEGAGGIMVPLTEGSLVLDLINRLELPVVVVAENYLGSINHTLLTLAALRARDLKVAALIFNGSSNGESEAVIGNFTADMKMKILRIPRLKSLSQGEVRNAARGIKDALYELN